MRKIFIFLSLAALCITACDCPDCGTLAFSPDVNTIFVTKDAGGTFHINPEHIVLKSSCQWAATNMTSQYLDFNNTNGGGGVFYLPISLTAAFFEALAEDISQFPLDATGYKIGSIHFDSNCEAGFDVDIYLKDFLVLSFALNEGIGVAPNPIGFVAGENITLPGTGATYSNKTFVGWGSRADGKGIFYDDGSQAVFSSSTTLYALWSGDGSSAANSKYIYNHRTLKAVSTTAADNLHYLVIADFNANYDEVANHLYNSWEPIGGTANAFTGFFEGNGHTISYAIQDDVPVKSHLGLFAYVGTSDGVTPGTIRNLTIEGEITVTNGNEVVSAGGVVGYLSAGEISNCVAEMDIDITGLSASMAVGGVVGKSSGSGALIQIVFVTGDISATGATSYVGGIVGHNANGAVVEKAYAAVDVLSKGSVEAFVGGIAGRVDNNGIVQNTHASGEVTVEDLGSGDAYAGGVVGYLHVGTLQNSYATGEVIGRGTSSSGEDYVRVGGLVGASWGIEVNHAYLLNCVALNNRVSTDKGDNVSRIWGYINNYVTRYNYAYENMEVVGRTITTGSLVIDGRNGAKCAAIPEESWWTDTSKWTAGLAWDFATIWIIGTDGYPKLRALIDLY